MTLARSIDVIVRTELKIPKEFLDQLITRPITQTEFESDLST
jgi:hypothetical protein